LPVEAPFTGELDALRTCGLRETDCSSVLGSVVTRVLAGERA